MRSRLFSIVALALMAGGLWVMPSVGTQGQGTLGDRFTHVDRSMFTSETQARAVLGAGDRAVDRAIEGL